MHPLQPLTGKAETVQQPDLGKRNQPESAEKDLVKEPESVDSILTGNNLDKEAIKLAAENAIFVPVW